MQCFSSTYNIASASAFYPSRPQTKSAKPSAFYTIENPQVRRSAFYQRQQADHFQDHIKFPDFSSGDSNMAFNVCFNNNMTYSASVASNVATAMI